jgi:D-alanyl-D-alanine carboxypeptidase
MFFLKISKHLYLLFLLLNLQINNASTITFPLEQVDSIIILEISNNKDIKILLKKNIEQKINPASLTKIMTTYVVLDLLKKNNMSLYEKVDIKNLKLEEPFFQNRSSITVLELLELMLVKSSNESAIILAREFCGNNVETFVNMMNQYAEELSLKNSHFVNPIGFYHENHYMSLSDIAKLVLKLQNEFAEFMEIFKKSFIFYNGSIIEKTTKIHNKNANIIGSKTGYIAKSKYNLSFWMKSKEKNFFVTFTGAKSKEDREVLGEMIISELTDPEFTTEKPNKTEHYKEINSFIANSILKYFENAAMLNAEKLRSEENLNLDINLENNRFIYNEI